MAKKTKEEPVKKSGSTHSSGKTALSFNKGSKNYTETTKKVNSDPDPLRSEPQKKKPVSPDKQTRAVNETMDEYKTRRDGNRAAKEAAKSKKK